MVQTWILRSDMAPLEALRSGADASTCGQCPLRPWLATAADRTDPLPSPPTNGKRKRKPAKRARCYVNVGNAPTSIYKAFARGSYPTAPEGYLASIGRPVRLGAYGDPSMVPFDVWTRLLEGVTSYTGYTHQWREPWYDARMGTLTMASADTATLASDAWELYHRTFRVRPVDPSHPDHALRPGEIACPASDEAGKRSTCATCRLCSGARSDTDPRRSVAIIAHDPVSRLRVVQ
jgi:hypothetical protein